MVAFGCTYSRLSMRKSRLGWFTVDKIDLADRSPEKAGVGGSIPSLATSLCCCFFSTYRPVRVSVPNVCRAPTELHDPAAPEIPESTWHSGAGQWRSCPPGSQQLPRCCRLFRESRWPMCAETGVDGLGLCSPGGILLPRFAVPL